MAQDIFNIAPGESQQDNSLRRKAALALLAQGTSGEPVRAWSQGAARMAQALMGGYDLGLEDAKDERQKRAFQKALDALPGLGPDQGQPPSLPPQNAPATFPRAPAAMADNEPPNPPYNGPPIQQASEGVEPMLQGDRGGSYLGPGALRTALGQGTPFGGAPAPAPMPPPPTPSPPQGAMAQAPGSPAAATSGPGQAPIAPLPSWVQPAANNPRGPIMTPEQAAAVKRMMIANPGVGMQLYKQFAQPREQWMPARGPNGETMFINQATGEPKFSPPQTNINLNTSQKALEQMSAKQAEDFQNAQTGALAAQKRIPMWQTMEQAAKGFQPGATAELKLTAKKYLKDMGLIEGNDVPDAQVFQMLQRQMQVHAQPKGQGSISNFERELFAQALPNMNQDPAALAKGIAIMRKLDEFDQKVGEVYRRNATANGGYPSIAVYDDIAKLGSPLTPADIDFLNRTKEGGVTATKSNGASIPAPPERKIGQAYQTPKGLMIWRGNGWEPVTSANSL